MDAPATLVWIAPEPPDSAQSRTIESWARSRGVVLAAPGEGRTPTLAVDPKVAEDVESLLDRARDAIGAREGDSADRAIDTADAMLRAHPELPQGAWLMAEVERARSARERRVPPVDDAAADRAWARAEAIDGGRVAGLGEQASASHPAAATIAIEVSPPDARVWLDGAAVRAGAVDTHAGPHLLVATWNGAPVWAQWVDTPAGSSAVRIVAPVAPACSIDDVSRAAVRDGAVDAAGVRCPAWVAAAPASPASAPAADGVLFATCEHEHCGPLLAWHPAASIPWQPPPEHRAGGWPTWATWGLVGLGGAVVATTVAIVASGALKPAPTATQFVSGGVKQQ
ncbi:MAG TPA: hypothetical protein VF765_00645 [Polyangiaceae bacterium]